MREYKFRICRRCCRCGSRFCLINIDYSIVIGQCTCTGIILHINAIRTVQDTAPLGIQVQLSSDPGTVNIAAGCRFISLCYIDIITDKYITVPTLRIVAFVSCTNIPSHKGVAFTFDSRIFYLSVVINTEIRVLSSYKCTTFSMEEYTVLNLNPFCINCNIR